MSNEEMAVNFVNKFPLLFNEDKEFWIVEVNKLLDAHSSEMGRRRKADEEKFRKYDKNIQHD